MKEIPLLTPSDVELRVSQIQQTNYGCYVTLLCYKDARCDMKVLDAVFGPMNWTRTHEIINGNLFCTVSIWDEVKEQPNRMLALKVILKQPKVKLQTVSSGPAPMLELAVNCMSPPRSDSN